MEAGEESARMEHGAFLVKSLHYGVPCTVELKTVVGETGPRGQESRAAIRGYKHYRWTNPVPRSMLVVSQVHGCTLLASADL